jgi:TetR/AcrR family transcriptional repressor of nem operon
MPMRVTREQAAENRDRVLETAGRLFRERGFGGVGVAELMNEAGLTHGGFYGQFESKDELKAQACEQAAARKMEKWRQAATKHPEDALSALVAAYVSPSHRDHPGTGCVVAALAGDAAREAPRVRRAVSDVAKSLFDTLLDVVPGRTRAQKRPRAAVTLASMVGAIVLARAIDDESLSNEILRAVKTAMSQAGGENDG